MWTTEIIKKLVDLVVTSSRIKNIELGLKGGKTHTIRAQNHLFILSPFGTMKTTLLHMIHQTLGDDYVEELQDMTKPGMIGTVVNNTPVTGHAIKASSKGILLVDEAEKLGMSSREVLLSLLEEQRYSRTLGVTVPNPIDFEHDFYTFHASTTKMGTILKITCNFSAIIATMSFNTTAFYNKALMSRCFPLLVTVDKEDLREMLFNAPLRPRVKPPDMVETVYFPDYYREGPKVFDRACEGLQTNKENVGYMTRVISNYARNACASAALDGEIEVQMGKHTHEAMRYARINSYMYLATKLPLSGLALLSTIDDHDGDEVSIHKLSKLMYKSEDRIERMISAMNKTDLIRVDKRADGTYVRGVSWKLWEDLDE